MTVYGYCRVSTNKQSIERQERNIITAYPNAKIKKETYTGTKVIGREVFNKLVGTLEINKDIEGKEVYKLRGGILKAGDILVFDEVSRMSRDAESGFLYYQALFNEGIELVFLKELHINTSVYKEAITGGIELTGTDVDVILEGVNKYMLRLAEKQIKLAFEQAEKEVKYLQQRTKEGLETAKREGKQIGIKKGQKLVTKKSIKAKEDIKKYSKDFSGSLKDADVIKLCEISRNSYYKYKKELLEEVSRIEINHE